MANVETLPNACAKGRGSDRLSLAAVLSIYFLASSTMLLNPAMEDLSRLYTDVPYSTVTLLSTVPNLLVAPVTLLTGLAVGRLVRYKTVLAAALALYLLGGVLPFFTGSFAVSLASRFLFGLGFGVVASLENVVVLKSYAGEAQRRALGLGSVVINLGGVCYCVLSGLVCARSVRYVWLIHLIAVVPLVMVPLFLPEPPKEPARETKREKIRLPAAVCLMSLGYGLVYMLSKTVLLNLSSILIQEELGTAATAGILLAVNKTGGVLGGVLFARAYRLAKAHTIPLCIVLQVIGMLCCWASRSLLVIGAGAVLIGIGHFIIYPCILAEIGRIVTPRGIPLAGSLMAGLLNVGAFLTSPYVGAVAALSGNADPRLPLLTGALTLCVVAAVWWAALFCRGHGAPRRA